MASSEPDSISAPSMEHGNVAQNSNTTNHQSGYHSMDSTPPRQQTRSVQGLAVTKQSKVDAELHARMLEGEKPSVIWVIVKWVATLLLMVTVLFCLTCGKLTVIKISLYLMDNRPDLNDSTTITPPHTDSYLAKLHGLDEMTVSANLLADSYFGADQMTDRGNLHTDTSTEKNKSESTFLMLLLILMIPQGFTFLLACWKGLFRSDRPWPSKKALFAGLVSSVAEVAGLTLFTLEVLSQSKGSLSVLLMNGVFFFPILEQLIKFLKQRERIAQQPWLFTLTVIAFLLEVAGLAVTAIFEFIRNEYKTNIWEIPLALVCLSFAWSPWLQKAQLEPRKLSIREAHFLARDMDSFESSSQNSGENVEENPQYRRMQEFAKQRAFQEPGRSARWKHSILTSFWKLLLTPAFSFLYAHVFNICNISKLYDGLLEINYLHPMFRPFLLSVFTNFAGYIFAILACAMCMQLAAFALPLVLTTPLTIFIALLPQTCKLLYDPNINNSECANISHIDWAIPAILCLYLAQLLSTTYFVFRSQTIIMHPEAKLFWLPGYNGVFLEQWLLLGRKTEQTDEFNEDPREKTKRTRVFICTTMYRENEIEMEQLLRSLDTINKAQIESPCHFESHIFFDGAVREIKLTEFVLQLIALLKKTLEVNLDQCTKVMTPYGMRLTWRLPPSQGKGMLFNIHLKDNLKVKNKKRWSQIMYMSYVIDWFLKEQDSAASDDETFILTTDADVKFTPGSVEALLDLMTRDNSVGAVCARTHPLGSGPIVWYQIFDYAIGHWFQKVANHVLGSVLCCPGCFSVYRIKALKDVLSTYASKVTKASEFLTKDMGEDRWLCTLMVQSGWRLEYCAVSEDSTHCPEEFDEFYKQRRRWIPSTLANQALVIQDWKILSHFNDQIGFLFIIYQAILLFSTLIGPATCILIVAGGLKYAYEISEILSTVLLVLLTVGYVIVCLYTTQDFQLKVAKLLTFLFALIMAAVTIGTATQIVQDLSKRSSFNHTDTDITTIAPDVLNQMVITTTKNPYPEGFPLPASISTLYLAGLVGIFLLAGLLHLNEFHCLLHGIWYLLCLPSGYLLLTIYSICNITDRSWGTREEKTVNKQEDLPWQEKFMSLMRKIFFCCAKEEKQSDIEVIPEPATYRPRTASVVSEEDGERLISGDIETEQEDPGIYGTLTGSQSAFGRLGDPTLPIKDWLRGKFKRYAPMFEDKGYEISGLLHGMTYKNLTKEIGIQKNSDKIAILDDIKQLPPPDLDTAVPSDYKEWLRENGLFAYQKNFKKNHIIDRQGFERLKFMQDGDLRKDLQITKPGHFKRLKLAISKLGYPTEREIRIKAAKYSIDNADEHHLLTVNRKEFEFWDNLRKETLLPDSKAFGSDDELKDKLTELRDSTLMMFAVVNALWMLIILTLASKSELTVLGSNPLGLSFLFVFGIVLVIQFLCMIFHRLSTLMHYLARAPYTPKGRFNTSWSFKKNNNAGGQWDQADQEAVRQIGNLNDETMRRRRRRREQMHQMQEERQPLLSPSNII